MKIDCPNNFTYILSYFLYCVFICVEKFIYYIWISSFSIFIACLDNYLFEM